MPSLEQVKSCAGRIPWKHVASDSSVTSAQNALDLGPEAALTGPVQRGDAETVRAHTAALADAGMMPLGDYLALAARYGWSSKP